MKKKNLAFTLAEVLIVIGIIGVVAALTLPNLNHATGDKETVTRVKKAYSIVSEAFDRATAIYGPVSEWTYEKCGDWKSRCAMKRIGEFLKVSKSCDANTDDCSDFDYMNYEGYVYQLADGMLLSISGANDDCTNDSKEGYTDLCFDDIRVDINGINKGKNEQAYDVFEFVYSEKSGLAPIPFVASECFRDDYRNWCTWWVIENGNLDYLKADEDGKCNDSDIILNTTTNTSCH